MSIFTGKLWLVSTRGPARDGDQGREMFFSYANTDTSELFVDNTDTIIKTFTNAFSNNTVPAWDWSN